MTEYETMPAAALELMLDRAVHDSTAMQTCEMEVQKIWLTLDGLVMKTPEIQYPGPASNEIVIKHCELAEKLRELRNEYNLFHDKVWLSYTKHLKKVRKIGKIHAKVKAAEAEQVAEKRPKTPEDKPEEDGAVEPPCKKAKTV